MRIPQWLAWPCVVVTALLAIAIIVLIILNPVPTFGGGYSCETRLTIAYKGMVATMEQIGENPQHPGTYPLARSMNDAFGPCAWGEHNYRCQNAP